jgi:tRNA threonylcarbamoyladenosine biosynthesis protein TsaB
MKILALDTSNNTSSVAVSDGPNILAYVEELRPSMQAECIINMIEQALIKSGSSYNEIDYLGVTKGPGSFTGIRIGLATAKGIALGTKINTIPVSNFDIAHFRAIGQVKNYDKFFILINAYRNQLYVQNFSKDSSSGKPVLMDSNIIIELLQKEKTEIVCAGSGIEVIYPQIKYLPNLTILPRFPKIRAMDICRYIYSKIPYLQSQPIEPLYIRPVDAKITTVIPNLI